MRTDTIAVDLREPDDAEVESACATLYSVGFCRFAEVLPEAATDSLRSEVARLSAEGGAGWFFLPSGELVGGQNLDQHSEPIFHLARTPVLVRLAERLLGGTRCVPFLTEYFGKPGPRSTPTPAHQDQVFYRRFFTDELGLTLWCPLADVGPADAPLEYAVPNALPGQFLEHTDADTFGAQVLEPARFNFRTVTAARGDIVVHHAYSVHRSAPNTSGRTRAAVALSYRTSAVRTWPRIQGSDPAATLDLGSRTVTGRSGPYDRRRR